MAYCIVIKLKNVLKLVRYFESDVACTFSQSTIFSAITTFDPLSVGVGVQGVISSNFDLWPILSIFFKK